jgi:hypothetical protein
MNWFDAMSKRPIRAKDKVEVQVGVGKESKRRGRSCRAAGKAAKAVRPNDEGRVPEAQVDPATEAQG